MAAVFIKTLEGDLINIYEVMVIQATESAKQEPIIKFIMAGMERTLGYATKEARDAAFEKLKSKLEILNIDIDLD